jgi:F-type H+-transporting ATPase subunit a
VVLLLLFIVALVFGPLGSAVLKTSTPDFMNIHKPEVSLPSEPIIHLSFFTITNTLIAAWISIILLLVIFYFATRKMKLIPGGLQNFAELVVESLSSFIRSVAGDKLVPTFLPVVGTIFLFVVTNAWMGLLPIFGTIGIYEEHTLVPIFRAANTDLNLTLSIAAVAFVFVEYLGIKAYGAGHYIGGFFKVEPLVWGIKQLFKGRIVGFLKGAFMGCINIFIGLIEVLSHIIRIVSFSFRLFGNMTAGELLILVITYLLAFVVPVVFYGLELFFGFIQALIFASLTLVFGSIALSAHSEE